VLVPGAGAKGGAVSFEVRVAARLRAAIRSKGLTPGSPLTEQR
jgi:DNA-binding GntR family transcriptional regulator